MLDDRSKPVLPGEKLAVLEEFEGGEGTYSDADAVRALAVGMPNFDMKERVVRVEHPRWVKTLPRPGDSVIGQVETAQGNIANVKIYYVNGRVNDGGFTGMLMLRQQGSRRSRRETVICKPGDLIRATVVSDVNAIIHLSLDRPEDGVIFTSCNLCGGRVVRERERVRCVECGAAEQRKLASDFGKLPLTTD